VASAHARAMQDSAPCTVALVEEMSFYHARNLPISLTCDLRFALRCITQFYCVFKNLIHKFPPFHRISRRFVKISTSIVFGD
jgi:hypothetical protein